jgi:SAM-dependent methyltransferase
MFEKSAAFYDALYSWKDYEGEVAKLEELIQRHRPGAKTILDVACGTGKHLELLRGRYEVEGADLDPGLLEIARERNPGVTFHTADMLDFDLGRTFDAVMCLFSSIGYVQTPENLMRATSCLARHVVEGGLLVIEPWLEPHAFEDGHIGLLVVDEPDIKITRMNVTRRADDLSILPMHYLVGTEEGVEHLFEEHTMGLFTEEQHIEALRSAGMEVRDRADLMGRGLYVAVKPG